MDRKPRPVRWLSPKELARSGFRAAISGTIGDYVDQRGMLALVEQVDGFATDDSTDIVWVDYVADVGDGYVATRAIANAIADDLSLAQTTLRRGSTLVFGGDQVYPTPSLDDYERRFLDPYDAVFEQSGRLAYAIPGNHDWYDGLTAFSSLFCSAERIGQVEVPQTRSYWIARPHPTWTIWGLDTALNATIDRAQLKFFRSASQHFSEHPGSKGLIVCVAEPFWEKEPTERFLDQLRSLIPESAKAVVFLSGDHHYFASWGPAQPCGDDCGLSVVAVTAGGGGAYLSLTHRVRKSCRSPIKNSPMRRINLWPTAGRSRAIAASVLVRIWMTPSFAMMVGFIYFLLGSLSRIAVDERVTFGTLDCAADPGPAQDGPTPSGLADVIGCVGGDGLLTSVERLADASLNDTPSWAAALILTAVLVAFARRGAGQKLRGLLLGLTHAAVQLVSAILVVGAAMWVPADLLSVADRGRAVTYLAGLVLGGAVAGTSVFAFYLVAAGLMGVNANELSTAAMHQGWKNFLRISLSQRDAVIYAIGLQKPDSAAELIATIVVELPNDTAAGRP